MTLLGCTSRNSATNDYTFCFISTVASMYPNSHMHIDITDSYAQRLKETLHNVINPSINW